MIFKVKVHCIPKPDKIKFPSLQLGTPHNFCIIKLSCDLLELGSSRELNCITDVFNKHELNFVILFQYMEQYLNLVKG